MSKAETDVQFFSHLNGISLDNKWGEMINLLDTCLVNGLTLPNISDVTIADDGRMTINFKSAHNCLLFQCVTLLGFSPSTFNDKYRIVGVPSTTQLLLSTDLTAQTATTVGMAMLSPLGYEIVFSANTKRVYRALNPTAQHPFIRVDESRASADGASVYADSYAKSAMVGLIENMTHIDDYEDPTKLQLPLDTSDFTKNWKISGTGENVVRGWSKWYWATSGLLVNSPNELYASQITASFSLIGNSSAFYLLNSSASQAQFKDLKGCGMYSKENTNWFLMSCLSVKKANENISYDTAAPLSMSQVFSKFIVCSNNPNNIVSSILASPILFDYNSGGTSNTTFNNGNIAALEIPFYDDEAYLRGTLPHVLYAGNRGSENTLTTPVLAGTSLYIWDSYTSNFQGGLYFYLGEVL